MLLSDFDYELPPELIAQAPAATAGDKAAPPAGPQAQPQNPHQWRDNRLIDFFCTLGVLLVLYPIARVLLKQWLLRREKLLGALDGDAIVYYYQQFLFRFYQQTQQFR